MKISDLAEGLQILAKYAGASDQHLVAAEHDELWVGDVTWPLTDADRMRLKELGFSPRDDMGWHVFT
jgi:hypothetical protein